MLQLYDRLLRFPLFYGLGSGELIQIVGHTKFDFRKYEAGDVVVRQGDCCRHLRLLSSGTLRVETASADGAYGVEEEVVAPEALQLECVYGLVQRYRSTFTASSEASFIVIDKRELTRLCGEYAAIRTNLVNLLAALAQKQLALPWRDAPLTLRGRIARFFADRCQLPRGHKLFHVLMQRVADEVGDSRRDVSAALRQMEAEGLLALRRGIVEIPALERL